ncbi:MAG: MFS transporter, partial [bacterium]
MIRTQMKTLNPVVVYIALARFVGALGFSISMPFLALYLHQELQIKPSVIGGMLTAAGILGALFSQIGGRLSDSLGRKYLLILLLGMRSFSFLLLAYLVWSHRGFGWFSLFYITSALFGTSIFPVMDAIVADVTPSSGRDSAYSLIRVAANLGWGIGPAIGGILVIWGYWWLFLITALLVFGSLVLIKWKIPETKNNTENSPKSYRTMALKDDAKLRLFVV